VAEHLLELALVVVEALRIGAVHASHLRAGGSRLRLRLPRLQSRQQQAAGWRPGRDRDRWDSGWRRRLAPTSMMTSSWPRTSGSRERTMVASWYLAVFLSSQQPSASSQWKVPLW
jgi:hypothetical protein